MAVYVDSLFNTPRKCSWRFAQACHMFADELDELHFAAETIGLKKAWFQNHPRLAHYDLTKNKRVQAIRNGAIEVTAKFVGKWMQEVNS